MDNGAEINRQNTQGDTPLHMAAFHDHDEACKVLVDRGANREARNKNNERALDLAKSIQVKTIVAPLPEDNEEYDEAEDDDSD